MNPFATLGVEPRFDLDRAELEEHHRALSKALHPDKHAGASASERRLALSRAIEVNEAFRALKDPIKRAEQLFVLAGVEVGETREPKPPAELLMEMMEAREELADAARGKDVARVRALGEQMTTRQRDAERRLAEAFGRGGEELRSALPALGELRYTRRFLDEVAAFEEALAE